MKLLSKTMGRVLLATTALLMTAGTARGEGPDRYGNADAVRGVRDGKGVFLVDLDDGRKLAMYLKLVAGTGQRLEAQGVHASLKVVFIGPSVKYLSTEAARDASPADRAVLADVAAAARALADQGVALEVCAIATDVFHVDPAKLIPGTKVVADGFVSLIGYQAQGYGLIPIF